MFVLPITILVIGVMFLMFGTYLVRDESVGLLVIFFSLAFFVGSSILFVERATDNAIEETKVVVLGHLDYEKTVTLTPQNDGTYEYQLNDSTSIDLFHYLTSTTKEK